MLPGTISSDISHLTLMNGLQSNGCQLNTTLKTKLIRTHNSCQAVRKVIPSSPLQPSWLLVSGVMANHCICILGGVNLTSTWTQDIKVETQ
jgi:hypothetical protein